uniref:Uncharacterized protein n=1 Tax=Labrus bergylta TaxID=56723 RepID=A0A3Q3E850_9LABR
MVTKKKPSGFTLLSHNCVKYSIFPHLYFCALVFVNLLMDYSLTIVLWNQVKFEKSHGANNTLDTEIVPKFDTMEEETHILIAVGFLLYTYEPLIEVLNKLYFHPVR